MTPLALIAATLLTVQYVPVNAKVSSLDRQRMTEPAPPTALKALASRSPENRPLFVLNADAEILLDGHPCAFGDVPNTAAIVHLEVTPDRRRIVRIHFRSSP